MSIAIIKKVNFDGARCPFSTFLRLQGDHHCACAQKWRHFSFFSKTFQTKKIKALRPKMTKIASRGGGSCLNSQSSCRQTDVIGRCEEIIIILYYVNREKCLRKSFPAGLLGYVSDPRSSFKKISLPRSPFRPKGKFVLERTELEFRMNTGLGK